MTCHDRRELLPLLAVINAWQKATGKTKKQMSREMGHNPNYLHELARQGWVSPENLSKVYAFCVATWPATHVLPSPLAMFARQYPDKVEAARTQPRPAYRVGNRACLCCGQRFHSEGIHNRMCAPCRAAASRAMV